MSAGGNVLGLLGDKLVHPVQGSVRSDHGRGKDGCIWGIYFSALWSAPCRYFDQELRTLRENLEKKGQRLDIVLVSSDRDEVSFKEHFGQMTHWMAIPYSDRTKATQLSRVLRVGNIPVLVLVDGATGRVITRDGCLRVSDDPLGKDFPWRPPSLDAVLHRGHLVDVQGGSRDPSELDSRVKGLYFSANWCPPCKAFTPQLVATYRRLQDKGCKFEVIFVSSDRSRESFDQYFGSMPWLAVPYADDDWRKEMAKFFGVQGIPTLVILDENNRIITCDGRYEVMEDPEGNNFPWKPNLVEELTDKHSTKLNKDPFLVLFTDGNDKDLEQARTMLLPVAQKFVDRPDAEELPLWFFVGGEAEICDSVREFAQLEDEVPLVAILDTINGEKYVLEDDVELNEDILERFVRSFFDGKIQPQRFRQ